jgi:hypothetical protein
MTHLGDTERGKNDRFPGIGIARIIDCVGALAKPLLGKSTLQAKIEG